MNASLAYIVSFMVIIVVSGLGSVFTNAKSEWYKCIKPSATPPRIVFPIVWTTLYVLIAIALARAMLSVSKLQRAVLKLFAINLSLNIVWCYAYFVMHDVYFSIFVIAVLFVSAVALVATTSMSGDKKSSYMLVPYVIWLAYASVLTVLSIEKEHVCRGLGF